MLRISNWIYKPLLYTFLRCLLRVERGSTAVDELKFTKHRILLDNPRAPGPRLSRNLVPRYVYRFIRTVFRVLQTDLRRLNSGEACACVRYRRIRPRPPKYFQIGSITCFRPANALKKYDEGGEQPMRWPCKYPVSRPPPQPVESQTSDAWIWGSLAVLVNFTMFICWAHTSNEARDLLTLYAPWLDEIISIVYQEDMTYVQFMFCWIQKIRRYMKSLQPKPENSCDPEKDPVPGERSHSKYYSDWSGMTSQSNKR